jgi:hypothetical protein
VVSFVYLSAECLFNKFYGINCRPKFDTKLLDRFFHRRRQVSPPVDNLRHRFLDGSQHVLYCNVTISSCHGAVALFIQKINLSSRMGSSGWSCSCPPRISREGGQYSQGPGTQRKTSPSSATWQTDGNDR